MQLVILIYQMTGAREQLPIYNHILILVAAYLFLSGYGHFVYLWFRGDAGFIRLLQVFLETFSSYFVVVYLFFYLVIFFSNSNNYGDIVKGSFIVF